MKKQEKKKEKNISSETVEEISFETGSKEMKKFIVKTASYLIIGMLIIFAIPKIYKFFNISDDNIVEEFVEKQIEKNVGIKIDITPMSKEK